MKLLSQFLSVLIAVLLVVLTRESEARSYQQDIYFDDDESSELTRRFVRENQETQQQTGLDKDKLEFPNFPNDEGSEFDQQQPSDNDETETVTEGIVSEGEGPGTQTTEDLVPSVHLDQYGQGQETEADAQNEVETDYKKGYNPITEEPKANNEIDDKPWYKKVGHFFKKHYGNLKDSIRGRRNDYYYTD